MVNRRLDIGRYLAVFRDQKVWRPLYEKAEHKDRNRDQDFDQRVFVENWTWRAVAQAWQFDLHVV